MKKYLLVGVFLLTAPLIVLAQYTTLKIADQEFEAFNYAVAVDYYQKAYDTRQTVRAMKGLAESYYRMRDFRNAEQWFGRLAQQDNALGADILHYAHSLRNNAKFMEAKAQYERLAQRDDRPITLDELELLTRSCDSATVWMQNPDLGHEIENIHTINSTVSEFGATPFQGQLLFVSDRGLREDGGTSSESVYGWTGNAYLQMYSARDGIVEKYPLSWYDANHHVGPVTISNKYNEVYFSVTRKLTSRERRKASRAATVNIEIFVNDLTAPDWGKQARPFRYNNIIEWSVGDPFLSVSGDTLYFVSDMPGGFGGTDIYYCVRGSDGQWGEAVNLGPLVNTLRDERSPALDSQGNLFFSSDGHLGMGGLDIFMVRLGQNTKPTNLGYPINSPGDDFSPRFAHGSSGFMASNRIGGKGSDDIYRFNLNREIKIDLQGRVLNVVTDRPISGADVRIVERSADVVEPSETTVITSQDGSFRFNLRPGMRYAVHASQTGFKPFAPVHIDTRGLDSSQTIYKELRLSPVEKEEVVVLRNIYFDFDKSDIRPDAAYELSKIVSFLNSDPTMRIELSAHTDSRGSEAYNMQLSQRRADAVIAFLSAAGIDPDRLTAKGYGFSRLANHCAPGVECTEEEHQYNRRVEFFVR